MKFPFFKSKSSQEAFYNWISEIVLTENPDKSIIAYNIGLIETQAGYTAYFMGAKNYNENDSDWACAFGDYTPTKKYLDLSNTDLKGLSWNEVQENIIKHFNGFMTTKNYKDSFLQNATSITVGFDDGELVRVK
jgi:hypothetical protein